VLREVTAEEQKEMERVSKAFHKSVRNSRKKGAGGGEAAFAIHPRT
jgi:hypothetical protein